MGDSWLVGGAASSWFGDDEVVEDRADERREDDERDAQGERRLVGGRPVSVVVDAGVEDGPREANNPKRARCEQQDKQREEEIGLEWVAEDVGECDGWNEWDRRCGEMFNDVRHGGPSVGCGEGLIAAVDYRVADLRAWIAFAEQVSGEVEEACEFVGWVDVVLDDVEGEVVGAGKGPDGEGDECCGFECGVLDDEYGGCGQAD